MSQLLVLSSCVRVPRMCVYICIYACARRSGGCVDAAPPYMCVYVCATMRAALRRDDSGRVGGGGASSLAGRRLWHLDMLTVSPPSPPPCFLFIIQAKVSAPAPRRLRGGGAAGAVQRILDRSVLGVSRALFPAIGCNRQGSVCFISGGGSWAAARHGRPGLAHIYLCNKCLGSSSGSSSGRAATEEQNGGLAHLSTLQLRGSGWECLRVS